MDFGIVSVGSITVIAYLIGQAVKNTSLENKWIPVICGASGGVLGILGLFLSIPGFPASDVITATAVGIVSGLAATGSNEIFKQLNKEEFQDI